MIFSNFIENLLGDRIKIRAYRILARHLEGMTGRGIASLIGTSPFKINQVLRQLVSESILEATTVGKAHLYRLNRRHLLVKDILLYLLNYEESLLKNLGKGILNRLDPKPLSVILYGSIAKGTETATSDLDLHFVYKNRHSFPSPQFYTDTLLSEWVVRTFGNPISVTRSTISEFLRRSKNRDPLIRNIIKEGRVLAGSSITEILDYGSKKN